MTSSLPAATWALSRLPRIFAISGAVLLIVLTVVAVRMNRSIVTAQTGSELDSLLTTVSNGVSVWYADQQRYAVRLSRREPLRDHGLALLHGSAPNAAATLDAVDQYLARQFLGIMVIDRDLSMAVSSQSGWTTASIPTDVQDRLHLSLAGEPLVTRPFLIGEGQFRRSVILLSLPLRGPSNLTVQGALLLAIDPDTSLGPLLRGAWRNDHGESYLASDQGLLLAGGRPFDELRALGLVPAGTSANALHLSLADPGRFLSPERPLSAQDRPQPTPVTRDMARNLSGEDLDGFRNYRGVQVIGAWRWIPELSMGVVCTRDEETAYRAVRTLEKTFLAALVVAAIGLGAGFFWFQRAETALRHAWKVQRRIDEIDRYVIGEKIGEGAMGSVFRATHARLRRPAAIKVIRPHAMTSENIARFEREAQLTCKLQHPNTVQIFDYGTLADGSLYYVMELLEGMSLLQLVRLHGPQPPGRVISILVQALGALDEAHRLGLTHRDVKPSNLFLSIRGGVPDIVKLLDFGLARDHESDAVGLTRNDTVLGSPSCMAPELIQRSHTHLSGSCDLYSLACVGYWLLTGTEVFERGTVMATLHSHCHEPPDSPSQRLGSAIPADLEAVIVRGLAKNPNDRFDSAMAFRMALLRCESADSWSESQAESWWKTHLGIREPPRVDAQAPTRMIAKTP